MASSYRFRVGRGWRTCPAGVWEALVGPKPHPAWEGCDGCTSSPDFWLGYALWPACLIHDWHYCADGPEMSRVRADVTFRLNLWRCLRAQGCPWWRAMYVAGLYHAGVRVGGRRHFKRRAA